ncbi:MAG: phosphatase [Pedobacter sp.]|nr:MAG: phosphatase [Pedobacter sp.]
MDAKVEALVNTVNTVGVMGKGIALQFRNAFPNNYKVYKEACKNRTFHTGEILVVKDHDIHGEKIIINFPTKEHWKQPSKYEYIESGLNALAAFITNEKIKSVALPPLGCGNGGLDWEIVEPMIERHLSPLNADILVYKPNDSVKQILQKEETGGKAKLTASRAMLLYALFYYEALGEYSSLFSANKLAYFLQRMGEDLKLNFKASHYGPYAQGVGYVLLAMNGTYLNGLEQNTAGAFEPLKLNYDRFDEVKKYVRSNLTDIQTLRLKSLINFINGFETELSLEVLSTVAFLLEQNPEQSLAGIINGVSTWNERKKRLFKERYIQIAYDHLRSYSNGSGLFSELEK